MHRIRLRIAGAMLLSTLLLSFAEAAWAATCDPAMAEMQQTGATGIPGSQHSGSGGMADMQGMESTSAGRECPPGSSHAHEPLGGGTGADCPFGPASGFGCAVSASLPAVATQVHEPAPVKALRHGATTVLAHDLNTHAIFHPPKA